MTRRETETERERERERETETERQRDRDRERQRDRERERRNLGTRLLPWSANRPYELCDAKLISACAIFAPHGVL